MYLLYKSYDMHWQVNAVGPMCLSHSANLAGFGMSRNSRSVMFSTRRCSVSANIIGFGWKQNCRYVQE